MDNSNENIITEKSNMEDKSSNIRMASMSMLPSIEIISANETTDSFSYDIEYPVISGLADKSIEDEINYRIKNQVYTHVESLKKTSQSRPIDHYSRMYSAYTSFEVKTISSEFISLVGIFGDYTGGAHGNFDFITYNINTSTGENIPLDYFFKSDFNYKQVINGEISNQIKNAPNDTTYFKEKGLRFESIGEMQSYYVENGNLVITFGLYEIAPYATGIPEFKIPMEKIESGLKPEILWILNN